MSMNEDKDPSQCNSDCCRLQDRDQLVAALKFASLIEQMLACEYLYAAFSAKKNLKDFPAGTSDDLTKERRAQIEIDIIRPWLAQIYTIARQEMEHLGIVQNLLAALGEEPYFMRPAFPVSSQHTFLHAPFRLDRFGRQSLQRFIWYERPDYLTDVLRMQLGNQAEGGLADLERDLLPCFLRKCDSVEKLYNAIKEAFNGLDPAEIFTGEPARQVGEELFGFRVKMKMVTNRESAVAAINLVLEQGEGIGLTRRSGEPAHFERFLTILRGFEEANGGDDMFAALPVVSNPRVTEQNLGLINVADEHVTRITNPNTVKVMELFNGAYSLMLVMMKSFFGTYSGIYRPEPRPQAAMFYAAFFPLMTMVVRPLGEVIARMPADGDNQEPEPGQHHAGASFEIDRDVMECRDGKRIIKTALCADYYRDALIAQAAQANELIEVVPASQRAAVQYLFENLTSTARHLESIWRNGR